MYAVVSEHVFPFLRNLGGEDSTYSHHMKGPAQTLGRVVADLERHGKEPAQKHFWESRGTASPTR